MWLKRFRKILKITGISVVSLLVLMFLLPMLFPDTVANRIKAWANQQIEGELNFSKARLSFFQHFPQLTLTLHDFSLKGSQPFERDTLMAGKGLSFGIDLGTLFSKTTRVSKFYVDDALINIQADSLGNANYNIYKGDSTDVSSPESGGSTSLKIEGIYLNNCRLIYNDRSLPMYLSAVNLYYKGQGDLSKDIFDLTSDLRADSLNLVYDGMSYLNHKKLNAALVTQINTSSLAFEFRKNDLMINKLPVDFKGRFEFVSNGYNIDLRLVSGTTLLENVFSIIPPEYASWLEQTSIKGTSTLTASLIGGYRAKTDLAPTMEVNLDITDGFINHNKAPQPLEQCRVNASLKIPSLNLDSLVFSAENIGFRLGPDSTLAQFHWYGYDKPRIQANMMSRLNLGSLHRATGLKTMDLRGMLNIDFKADGYYLSETQFVKGDTLTRVTQIPQFTLKSSLDKGYFKLADMPMALENLGIEALASSASGKPSDLKMDLNKLEAKLGNGYLRGFLKLGSLVPMMLDAKLDADLALGDFLKAVPVKDYDAKGSLRLNAAAKGLVDLDRKRLPAMQTHIAISNGYLKTPYYPAAMESVTLNADLDSKSGSVNDLKVKIDPLSFQLDGEPFIVKAALSQPSNLIYNIVAKGRLNLGKIYQLFALEGYNAQGIIDANLSLSGSKADALAGRYQRLHNSGSLAMENIALSSPLYPDPFLIPEGHFKFNQDKAWLTNTTLKYGKNAMHLDGYVSNIAGYLFNNESLTGALSVQSDALRLEDFMVVSADSTAPSTGSTEGVVQLPKDLDLSLRADVKQLDYNGLPVKNLKGILQLKDGAMLLDSTRLELAGAKLLLNARYEPMSVKAAHFTLGIRADSFDVKRAYKEVDLFRSLASGARYAEGIISLHYNLEGKLDEHMYPAMRSLKGQGQLRLVDVKLKGMKLFKAVSKASGKDSLDNPNLKAVVIKSSIANNLITIPRTKMRIMGFRPRIEGQTSLDGKLNLKFRLGLPPFGIIGIPMSVTGTAENPIVKMRQGKEADELEEEEETDEDDQ